MLKLALPNDTRIGHVHLRVSDMSRSKEFYCDVLGFHVTIDGPTMGLPAVFMAAGVYHQDIGLNTFGGPGASPSPPGYFGLYHYAVLYPDQGSLSQAITRVYAQGRPISHAADHKGTVSVYLQDPDGIGIELYYDQPRAHWFEAGGRPVIRSEVLASQELLTTLEIRPRAKQVA